MQKNDLITNDNDMIDIENFNDFDETKYTPNNDFSGALIKLNSFQKKKNVIDY